MLISIIKSTGGGCFGRHAVPSLEHVREDQGRRATGSTQLRKCRSVAK